MDPEPPARPDLEAGSPQRAGTGAAPEAGGAPPQQTGAAIPGADAGTGAHSASTRGRTRLSAAFVGACAALVLLVILIVFIVENTESVKINFLGASGRISLGVALLIAAVGGGLVSAALGAARILQLRVRGRRRARKG